jgi:DNA-directed RNA polymerase subunit alpha
VKGRPTRSRTPAKVRCSDYDKLTLDIETDGSVTPEDAWRYAARILQDQLQMFINFEEPKAERSEKSRPSCRSTPNLLQEGRRAGAVGAFGQLPEERQHRLYRRPDPEDRGEMLRTPNFGRKSLNEIKEVLQQMGLHLGMDIPNWPPENIEELAKRLETHY